MNVFDSILICGDYNLCHLDWDARAKLDVIAFAEWIAAHGLILLNNPSSNIEDGALTDLALASQSLFPQH